MRERQRHRDTEEKRQEMKQERQKDILYSGRYRTFSLKTILAVKCER